GRPDFPLRNSNRRSGYCLVGQSIVRLPEITLATMAASTGGKSRGAGGAFRIEDPFAVAPLAVQSGVLGKPVLQIDGAAVGAHANLRKSRNFAGHLLGSPPRLTLGHDLFAQADTQALLSLNLAARHNDLKCTALPDETRQTHGASVRQWYPPTAAIDAHIGAFGHDAAIGPQGELHAPGDRRALDGRDNRFAEPEARRPHWPAWNRTAILGKFQRGRAGRVAGCKFFQIDAGAERSGFAPKDGDVGSVIAIESQKDLIQGFSMLGLDSVTRRGTRMNNR